MRSVISLLSLSSLLIPVQSLYFYIDGTTPKCFYEELPKDTLVVGHYTAEEYSIDHNRYISNENLNIFISVDVSPPFTASLSAIKIPFLPFINKSTNQVSRKYSTMTTAWCPKKAARQGASHSQPPTPATTRSASRLRTPRPILDGCHRDNHWVPRG